MIVAYHPSDAPEDVIYVAVDDETGHALCYRCGRALAQDDGDESEGAPLGCVAFEAHGYPVAICPGCRVSEEAVR